MLMSSNRLLLYNPWWLDPASIQLDQHLSAVRGKSYRFVPRLVQTVSLEAGDISIIRGARQVGKTTTFKMIIERLLDEKVPAKSIFYFSCEALTSFQELQSLLVDYLENKKDRKVFLFLDEISFVPEWQRAILAIANLGLTRNASLLLTGSNARDLKESSERLPGRRGSGRDYQLFPLALPELKQLACFESLSPEKLLEIYFHVGGFPLAIADYVKHGVVRDMTYEIYRNWIIGDAGRYHLQQETLKQILFRIAETVSSQITWPRLIENSPVRSHETAPQYVEHLQDAFLCHIHYCYDPERNGPVFQKARKIYFIDPLLYALAWSWHEGTINIHAWMEKRLTESEFRGRLFESVVVNHVSRLQPGTYFWYSSQQKKEVDLLIREGKKIRLYEIKQGGGRGFRALNHPVEIIDPSAFLQMTFRSAKESQKF